MQHEEHLCHACRSPLNAYPFSARVNGKPQEWCSATCYTLWSRERRHQASIAFASRLASFFAVDDAGNTSSEATETQKPPFIAITAFLAGVVLAIAASA
jgi:hypothetical protein